MPSSNTVSDRSPKQWSYIIDWISTLIYIAVFYSLDYVHGFFREFSLVDTSIQHTFATRERVPLWALYLIAVVTPFGTMAIVNVCTVRSLMDWHNSCLGLLLSLSLTGALTQIVKITVGRPRPDLIARCQPVAGSQNAVPFGLVTSAICTQSDMSILKDGFRSFFSGHSSLSFAGLGFLSWYLAGKLHLFDRRGHPFKAWIALAPLAGAILVAVSRTMDYRHHWQDVTVGSLVGASLSFFAYRQYFPSPLDAESHKHLNRQSSPSPIPTAALKQNGAHTGYRNMDGNTNGSSS